MKLTILFDVRKEEKMMEERALINCNVDRRTGDYSRKEDNVEVTADKVIDFDRSFKEPDRSERAPAGGARSILLVLGHEMFCIGPRRHACAPSLFKRLG